MKIREIKLMFVPVVLSVALSLGACADFLEETSESKRVMNNFYKTTEELEAGQQVYLQNAAGQPFPVKVVSKDDTTITFDANHEMAGKELNFTIELVSVEE